jgi:hypothetical protein
MCRLAYNDYIAADQRRALARWTAGTVDVELREGNAKFSADAGLRKTRFDYRRGFSRHRSDPLAVPKFFWLGRQTPWRHFSAEGEFFFLFSDRHLHPRQYRNYALELVIPALNRKHRGHRVQELNFLRVNRAFPKLRNVGLSASVTPELLQLLNS